MVAENRQFWSGYPDWSATPIIYCGWGLLQSRKPHPSQREEGSGHTATIELSPQQKLDVTNQMCALRRSHLLSWSTIIVTAWRDPSSVCKGCGLRD